MAPSIGLYCVFTPLFVSCLSSPLLGSVISLECISQESQVICRAKYIIRHIHTATLVILVIDWLQDTETSGSFWKVLREV